MMDRQGEPLTSGRLTNIAIEKPTIPSLHFTLRSHHVCHSLWPMAVRKRTKRLPLIWRWIQSSLRCNDNCKEHIVDDTIFYDENLEEHWWRAISFLSTVGQAGIVLNPTKFQFASKSQMKGLTHYRNSTAPLKTSLLLQV